VQGPPGVGKTRLLGAARESAREGGLLALSARGADLERDLPFGVARQLVEPVIATLPADERAALFAGAAGLATNLLDDEGDAGVGAQDAFAMLHALYWLLVNLADRAPVLVCVDDAHWADEQSLRFLDYLARRIDGLPLAIVVAGRPPADDDPGSGLWSRISALPAALALHPQPLSAGAARRLVREELGPDASPEFCSACHRATQGNPLFLRELLRALGAAGVTPSADAVNEVEAAGPGAVRRFVLHRLAGLGATAVEVARAVAVMGDGVDARPVARVAAVDEAEVREVADALVRADVLSPTERLSFVHPIVRSAVYEDLAPGERLVRHALAAEVLLGTGAGPERVAAHLLHTSPTGDGGRVTILRAAAASAAQRGAPESAAVFLRRALKEPPAFEERTPILVELGSCELAATDFAAADEHLREALATDDTPAARASAASLLARCAVVSGGRSSETAAEALEALAGELRPDDPQRSVELVGDMLLVSAAVPRLRSALPDRLERVRRWAVDDPRFEAVAEIYDAQEALYRGEAAASVVERIQAVLAGGLPAALGANALFVALSTLRLAERYDLASRWLDVGLEVARREGHVTRLGILHGQRAAIALARGGLDHAQLEAEIGLSLVDERHFVVLQLAAISMIVHIERGDLAAAAEAAERGAAFGDVEDYTFLDDYLTSRGRLRIARGEVEEGVADLLDAGRRTRALGLCWPGDWRAFAAPALAALGDREQAARLAGEQIALARAVGAPGGLGRALRLGGLVAGGEEGLALLEEAVAVLEPAPARLELAHAFADLGTALTRQRRLRDGRELQRLALQLATKCGATRLAEHARAELTAGGGRRARLERTGVHALTPAERRVCELAASGELTNRAIAQTLFVTEKTVELHLRNAYRKLAIRSRFQLADALSR
jgi:DNA-binding CsgD family transcriptional regulator